MMAKLTADTTHQGLIVADVVDGTPILRFACEDARLALNLEVGRELLSFFHEADWEFLIRWNERALGERWLISPASAPDTEYAVSFAVIEETYVVLNVDLPAETVAEEASLTHLARGVAHDINNYLATIKATLTGLRLTTGAEWEHDEVLAEALQAADGAASLARRLLRHSKPDNGVSNWIDAARLLRETARIALAGSTVSVEIQAEDDLPGIRGEEGQISQVFSNLLVNARQAMKSGGKITARVRMDGSVFPPALVISVRDQGHGIPQEILPRIFDRNFTTKEEGSGLGLDICRSIVRRHHGDIEVWSEPFIGTEFTLRFPAEWPETSVVPITKSRPAPVHSGTGRVLIVEDQAVLRRVAATGLTRLGYEAIEAESGEAALELFRARHFQDNIDAAIVDLQLPGGMSGTELAFELKERHPGIRLIVSSGSLSPGDPVQPPFDHALPKPYDLAELSDALLQAFTELPEPETFAV